MPAVACALSDAGQQQRAARDRFEMLVGFGEADKDVPPVVDQRDHACGETTAREIFCREAASRSVACVPHDPTGS